MSDADQSDQDDRVAGLFGVWSSEWSGLYYSGFEDESLSFDPRGSGWYQFSRPDYADISYFTWRAVGAGRIELSWVSAREISDGVVTDRRPEPSTALFAYRINEEDTPLAGRRLVLRIDPALAFAREFGLSSRDPTAAASDDI